MARGGGGVELSERPGDSSKCGLGLFSGLGVSFSFAGAFAFAAFLCFGVVSFFRDFFFAVFRFGVALGDFVGFCEAAVGSGVSLGLGFGVVSFFSLVLFVDLSVAALAFAIGLGDSSGVGDVPVSFRDLSVAGLAFAIGLGDFSGVGDETLCV
jgi:hypothetical protein